MREKMTKKQKASVQQEGKEGKKRWRAGMT